VSGGLGGTGLIADDLYLMAHHETSGRTFLQPRPLGIGLAGGLLAEVMLGGCVFIAEDGGVTAGRTWPGDDLARQVRDQVAAESGAYRVTDWLLFLGQSAAVSVAGRLEQAGYLTRAGGRVPWRSPRWVPVNPDWAFAPLLRARPATDAARPLTAHAAVLAGLAAGCGLRFRLDQYLPATARSIDQSVSELPPDLQQLIAAVQAAVDGAVLAHRT
jgi:outer membrane murein-binding lipoprotein Lpp